jgi:hypothetical protein
MSFDDLGQRRITDRPKVNINVVKSTSVQLYGAVTLDQLREFVNACRSLGGNAKVSIKAYAGDQRDGSYTTITVHDA